MSSSKIQRYGVDNYVLKINPGGTIEIDPGPTGAVTIDGDLTVLGNTTTIESQDLVIVDSTIKLGKQVVDDFLDQTDGMALGQGGLVFDRGTRKNVGLFFHEELQNRFGSAQDPGGAFILGKILADTELLVKSSTVGLSNIETVGIYLNAIDTTNGNDLNFLRYSDFSSSFGSAGPRLNVFGTVDYEKRIFQYSSDGNLIENLAAELSPDRISRGGRYDPDLIPNILAVTDFVQAHYERNFQSRLISPGPDGFVSPGNFATGFSEIELSSTDAGDPVSKIDFRVSNLVSVASYFQSEIRLFDVKVNNNTLSTTITDGDVKLSGNGTGSVKIISPLNLKKITDPAQPINGTTVYAKDEADGGTGIFFINEVGTQDELISRNKALLFSIIF